MPLKNNYSKITPEEWSFTAPVTDFKQLTSFLILNTPKKPKIKASLKSIRSSEGFMMGLGNFFLIKEKRKSFLTPPPVNRIEAFLFLITFESCIKICSEKVLKISGVLKLYESIKGKIYLLTHSVPKDFGGFFE